MSRGWGQTLLGGAQDKKQSAQTGTQEAPSEYEEKLLTSGLDRALEQGDKIGCGVSSGNTQNPPGRNPVLAVIC